MFVFDRSAIAVIAPLALLLAAVLWANRGAPRHELRAPDQTVAASLPSR